MKLVITDESLSSCDENCCLDKKDQRGPRGKRGKRGKSLKIVSFSVSRPEPLSIPPQTVVTLVNWALVKPFDYLDCNFNLTTGVFTVPKTGKYSVWINLEFSLPTGLAIVPQVVPRADGVLIDDYFLGLPIPAALNPYAYTQVCGRNCCFKKCQKITLDVINADAAATIIVTRGTFSITRIG